MHLSVSISDGRAIPLVGEVMSIGSGPACDICFTNDNRLHSRHALLKRVGNRWLIEAIAPGCECAVSGKMARLHWLEIGDEISFGPGLPVLCLMPEWEQGMATSTAPNVAVAQSRRILPWVSRAAITAGAAALCVVAAIFASRWSFQARPGGSEESERAGENTGQTPVKGPPHSSGTEAGATIPGQPASVILADAHAEPASVATEKAPLDPPAVEGRISQQRQGIVWIGMMAGGSRYPLCSGWAISETEVVTIARPFQLLQRELRADEKLFVFVLDQTDSFIDVIETRIHPGYLESNPHFNVAVLRTGRPLPTQCTPIRSAAWQEALAQAEFFPAGFELRDAQRYDPVAPPSVKVKPGRLLRSEPSREVDGAPTLVLQGTWPRSMDGSPVFDSRGRVFGSLLVQKDGGSWVIPAARATELLTGTGP